MFRDERDCAWFTFNEEDGACVLLEDCQVQLNDFSLSTVIFFLF